MKAISFCKLLANNAALTSANFQVQRSRLHFFSKINPFRICESQIEGDEALFALSQTFPDNLNTIIALNVRIFGLERAFQLTPTMQATNISNNGVLALSKFLHGRIH